MGIRRVLIVVVGFCLFVNLVLLGLAKFGPSQSNEPPALYDVSAWTESQEVASALQSELEGAGLTVVAAEVTRSKQVPDGFRAVMKSSNTDILVAAEETLEPRGHTVKLLPGGNELQLGGVFQKKAEAEAKAKIVSEKYGFIFEVEDNFKDVPTAFQELRIEGVEREAADKAIELIDAKEGVESDVQERPTASAEGEPAEAGGEPTEGEPAALEDAAGGEPGAETSGEK